MFLSSGNFYIFFASWPLAVFGVFGLQLFLSFCPPAVLSFLPPRLFRQYFGPVVFRAFLYLCAVHTYTRGIAHNNKTIIPACLRFLAARLVVPRPLRVLCVPLPFAWPPVRPWHSSCRLAVANLAVGRTCARGVLSGWCQVALSSSRR